MRLADVHINGIGVHLPPTESAQSIVDRGILPAELVDRMGFTSAGVAGDLPAPEMALRAARDAVKQSGVSPGEVDLLLYADVWHQGPTSWQPQLYLQRHLVGDSTRSVEVRQGCVGLLTGIELAAGALRSVHRAALVVAVTAEPGLVEVLSMCTIAHAEQEERWHGGEALFPPGVTLGKPVDFLGGQQTFAPQSVEDLGAIALAHMQRITECTQQALDEAGVTAADIALVVPNNMPREEGRAYLGMLGFGLERSTWEHGRALGHMGASDQAVALHHLLRTGRVAPGDHLLVCGLAPGITYKAGVVRVTALP
jgi:3-oxoacyl-[acyl-carrier-protein] synthase III